MADLSAERRAELRILYPIGGHLTVTDPLPNAGWIAEHGEHGIKVANEAGRTVMFLSWAALSTARISRSAVVR